MNAIRNNPKSNKLNIGCGDHYHADWCNLDVRATDSAVMECDIRNGLPFSDETFDVVYHSHVLEHLTAADGERLMQECRRVLRSGGVVRVVVPDLETIAALYLEKLRRADADREETVADYLWMKLELLDQMVRDTSGGLMGQYMADPNIVNSEFVRSRIGNEYWRCRPQNECPENFSENTTQPSPTERLRRVFRHLRERLARKSVRLFLGRTGESALVSGLFREQGEIHRWMHDRFSMNHLCQRLGFSQFRICGPESSSIADFATYQLDAVRGVVRKPDSLFVECRKPIAAAAARAA